MASTRVGLKINQVFKRIKNISCLEGTYKTNLYPHKRVEFLLIVHSPTKLAKALPFSCNGFSKKLTLNWCNITQQGHRVSMKVKRLTTLAVPTHELW